MFEAPASITLNRPSWERRRLTAPHREHGPARRALARCEVLGDGLVQKSFSLQLGLGPDPTPSPSTTLRFAPAVVVSALIATPLARAVLCRRCPRLHRPRPHPPTLLPALVAAAYASHVTLCSTTLHSPIVLARGSHSPRSKKSELRSLLSHQPEAVNPRVPAGPFTTKTSTPAIHI